MNNIPMRLGLISAMHQEQAGLIEAMTDVTVERRAMRDYTRGTLWGHEAVCVLGRIGKVAAATTAATLIERFGVTHILFTGVAGGAGDEVKPGDIVVADSLVQHDMDATPLFPRYEVPLLGRSLFATDLLLSDALVQAAGQFLERDLERAIDSTDRTAFRLVAPRLHRGLIASSDEFIDSGTRLQQLRTAFPDLLAVEMEGAAVAQVCFEFGIPFAVIRTISDGADESAPMDFMRFMERIAARYAQGVLQRFLQPG